MALMIRSAVVVIAFTTLLSGCPPPDVRIEPPGEGEGEGEPLPAAPLVLLPKTGISAAELGVVFNGADPQSVAVKDAYVAARGIPLENIVEVTLPVAAVIAPIDFAPAKAAVDALPANVQALALTWTNPYGVGCMSIGTAFAIAYDEARFCSVPCAPTEIVATSDSDSHAPFTDLGVRPTMMLAATSVDDAVDLIARGVAADGTSPSGTGFLVATTDAARTVRAPLFPSLVNEWSHEGGLDLRFVDRPPGDVITDEPAVLFYFTGLVDVTGLETNSYVPGAVADHLTSFGGQVPTASGQMSDIRWLQAGATASYGTVIEPCNFPQKFPDPAVLTRHYFRGEPVIEAYWKSVAMPGEGLFVGEPLARPWGNDEIEFDAATRRLTIRTNLLKAGVDYRVDSADSAEGPFTPVLDVSTLEQRRVEIVVEDAVAAVYRLIEAT